MTDIKVSKMDVVNDRRLRSVRFVLGAGDVLPPKKCEATHSTHDGSVFSKDCASLQQNRHINPEWKNSPNVNRTKYECVVMLERLSPEMVATFLSQKKEHRRSGVRSSLKEMHNRCKAGKNSDFQKSSRKCGMKEQTQGIVRFHKDGMFDKQNCDNTWGDTKLDSWGNVRYLTKGRDSFSDSEEDWHGWCVHTDSLHNLATAQLYSVWDGVKESRTVVWDSVIEPMTAAQDKGIQIPEQTTYVCDGEQYKMEEDVSNSLNVTDEEDTDFFGFGP